MINGLVYYSFFLTFFVVGLYFSLKLAPSPSSKFFQDILLGHRGCRIDNLPENSIESIEFSNEKNSDGSEFDIQLTKDNQVIVFHDTKMLELQDVKGNPFKGDERIDQLTLKELQTYFRFKNGKKGTVSTFKELLERMHQLNPKMKMMIEIKSWVNLNYIIDEVIEMYKKYDLYQRASVGSFNPMVLYKLRARNPKIVTLLLVKKHLVSAWYATDINSTPKFLADMNPTLKSILYQISLGLDYVLFYSCKTWLPSFLGVGVLGVDINLIRDGDLSVETIQNQGYVVNVWVVNELKEKEELKQQKVAITTDYLF